MQLQELYQPDEVPSVLQQILDLQERFGALADDFEAWLPEEHETEDRVKGWFPKSTDTRLITIGTDHSGALYVLWCRNGCTPDQAPVAYLGSEGEGNTVLAESLTAFLELLGTGSSWGPYEQEFYPPEESEDDEGPIAFRRHYEESLGQPRAPEAIRSAATEVHPGFGAWVDSQCSR